MRKDENFLCKKSNFLETIIESVKKKNEKILNLEDYNKQKQQLST